MTRDRTNNASTLTRAAEASMARRASRTVVPVLVLLIVLLAGCAAPRPLTMENPPAWPPPPAEPRIVMAGMFQGPADLAEPGFFEQLVGAVAGKAPQSTVRPHSISVDGERIAITDQERQGVQLLRLGTRDAAFLDRAGQTYFVSPVGVAWVEGHVAVTDSGLGRAFLLSDRGRLLAELTPPGGFDRPTGAAFDRERRELYVVDTIANRVHVFAPTGAFVRSFGERGGDPGQFNNPTHIAVGGDGRVYVTDSLNFRVQALSPEGRFAFQFGQQGDASGHLGVPKGVGVDGDGHIYIVDSLYSTIQIFDRQGRLLLLFGQHGEAPGMFQVPGGLTIDRRDRIYVCDTYNGRVQVFQYLKGARDE